MAKLKAAAIGESRSMTSVTPISQGRKPRAVGAAEQAAPADRVTSETVPAVIVFGRDDAGETPASRFSAADTAAKAAGLMGYSVLPVASPDMCESLELAEGESSPGSKSTSLRDLVACLSVARLPPISASARRWSQLVLLAHSMPGEDRLSGWGLDAGHFSNRHFA